jgi:uncharacterized protein YeaO (DUF488 family)
MSPRRDITLHRVYDRRDAGYRVLVDRLWPRGITRADAALGDWLQDVAPSTELRRWYGHDVARFEEFARRYRAELRLPPASNAVQRLIELAQSRTITLLTATRDVEHSAARVLQKHLTSRASRSRRRAPPAVAVHPISSADDRRVGRGRLGGACDGPAATAGG